MKRSMLLLAALTLWSGAANAEMIVGVSIPVNSQDESHPFVDNVWSVHAPPFPLNVNLGIGYIINPDVPFVPNNFAPRPLAALHDHGYVGLNVPDPTRAVVTYEFDVPTIVDQLELIQHQNGVTQVEGFVGDSLGSLSSIGSIFGPDGDVTGSSYFAETSSYVFDFNNTTPGLFFQFVIRKTSFDTGYATYRAFPRDAVGVRFAAAVPEPASLTMAICSLLPLTCGVVARRRLRGATR